MPQMPIYHSIERLFRSQLTATTELSQLLKDENSALIDRDYELSQQIIKFKQLKTAEIESLSHHQAALLASTGLPNTAESLNKIINSAVGTTKTTLIKLRSQLENSIQVCKDQNIINGQIIAVNQHSIKTALAILRGQFNSAELIYGSGGQTITDNSGNPITKA